MTKKPETRLKEAFLARLWRIDRSWWEKIQQVSIRGTPDIIGCFGGDFYAYELKADEDEKPDPLQQHKLDCIRQSGGTVAVVHPGNMEQIVEDLWQTYSILRERV